MIGVARRWESNLSNAPPWPGNNVPVSFILFSLLWKLIIRSPINANIPPRIKINISKRLELNILLIINPRTALPINPPTKPSHVLLGLIFGVIKCFPIFEPVTYAKVSKIDVLSITIRKIE